MRLYGEALAVASAAIIILGLSACSNYDDAASSSISDPTEKSFWRLPIWIVASRWITREGLTKLVFARRRSLLNNTVPILRPGNYRFLSLDNTNSAAITRSIVNRNDA